jgi:hypothetical protein
MTLLAAGLVLLATTRPFEGICAAIPLMIGLSPRLYRAWAGKQRKRLLATVLTSAASLWIGRVARFLQLPGHRKSSYRSPRMRLLAAVKILLAFY